MTSEDRAKLQAEVGRLEGELAAAKTRLYSKDKNEGGAKSLQFWRWALWAFLLVFVLGAALWAVFVILNWTTAPAPLRDFSLASAVGLLGAALSGLMSLNERLANGWEFEDGSREPDPGEKKERFNSRLTN